MTTGELVQVAEAKLSESAAAVAELDALLVATPAPDDEPVPNVRREKAARCRAIEGTRSSVQGSASVLRSVLDRVSGFTVAHERLTELRGKVDGASFAARWLDGDAEAFSGEAAEIAILRACLKHGVGDPGRIEPLSTLARLAEDGAADLTRAVQQVQASLVAAASLRS